MELIIQPPIGCAKACPGCYLNQSQFHKFTIPKNFSDYKSLSKQFTQILSVYKPNKLHFFFMDEGVNERHKLMVKWNALCGKLANQAMKNGIDITYSFSFEESGIYISENLLTNMSDYYSSASLTMIISYYLYNLNDFKITNIPKIYYEPKVGIFYNFTINAIAINKNSITTFTDKLDKYINLHRICLKDKQINIRLTLEKPYSDDPYNPDIYALMVDYPAKYLNNEYVNFDLDSCYLKSLSNTQLSNDSYGNSLTITANKQDWFIHICPYQPQLKSCNNCILIKKPDRLCNKL